MRFVSLGCEEAMAGEKRKSASVSLSKHVSDSLDSGKTDFRISAVFCFSFLLIHLVSKATGSNLVFYYYFMIFIAGSEESTSSRTDLGVNKKGFLNL